jgi:hypothetical protein
LSQNQTQPIPARSAPGAEHTNIRGMVLNFIGNIGRHQHRRILPTYHSTKITRRTATLESPSV